MLSPVDSLYLIAGRFPESWVQENVAPTETATPTGSMVGIAFGDVEQRRHSILRSKGQPTRYGALYCYGCNKPLPNALTYPELQALTLRGGCIRLDCRARLTMSKLEERQKDLTNAEKIAINLTMYKLMFPELVPATYGGTFGFHHMQPVIQTGREIARKFCNEMGIKPDDTSKKLFLHLGRKEEALIPHSCLFRRVIPECLLQKMQDYNFTLKCGAENLTFFDLEEIEDGKFAENILARVSPRNYALTFDERTNAMSAIFTKVLTAKVKKCVKKYHPAATDFYSSLYQALKSLELDESLEISNIPEQVGLGNLYNALKRRGLNAGQHYSFNKKIFTEDGKKLPKETRIYIASKLEEFPENDLED